MENQRRKEHATSATISEEGSLALRTKLHHPLLGEEVVARGRLLDWLRGTLHTHRLILIYAPLDRLE